MKLGIGSYTFGWASGTYGEHLERSQSLMTLDELIDSAIELEAEVIQVVNYPNLPEIPVHELEQSLERATSCGIEFEVGTVGADPENLRSWLSAANALDAKIMRTLLPNPTADFFEERKNLESVKDECVNAGVRIAIENHETSSVESLKNLVTDLGSEFCGVCLDTVNSLGRGEGVWEVFNTLIPVTINFHVKDFTVTRGATDMGFTVTGASTGEGKLNIPKMIQIAHEHDPEMNVILEQWTPLGDDMPSAIEEQIKWAKAGAPYLKKMINSL